MYTKEWLLSLPVGTRIVCGDEPAYIYTLLDKQHTKRNTLTRYFSIPMLKERARIVYDNNDQMCYLSLLEKRQQFPLAGRLKQVILPESPEPS